SAVSALFNRRDQFRLDLSPARNQHPEYKQYLYAGNRTRGGVEGRPSDDSRTPLVWSRSRTGCNRIPTTVHRSEFDEYLLRSSRKRFPADCRGTRTDLL